MPLFNPIALKNAFVATPNPAGSAPFGATGIGIRVTGFNAPTFVKFVAQAGLTYTVGTNVLTGDTVLTGPDGNPLNPGTAIHTFSFTPLQTGLYVLGFVANPRFVVSGQTIFVNIQANQEGVPITIDQALDPFALANSVLNGSAFKPATQYFLHLPDNNGSGLATASPSPTDPTLLNTPNDSNPLNTPLNAFMTPLETNPSNNLPLTWVGATNQVAAGAPTPISVSLGTLNFPTDQNGGVPFSGPMPQGFLPLIIAAEDVWESVANIKFNNQLETGSAAAAADIRVGVADISSALGDNSIGFTNYSWNANNKFENDNLVRVEDPNQHPVTAMSDGDFLYNGTQTTVFQDLLHELGHAIGLAHNPNDPTSIMNPVLSSTNPYPDNEDIASVQALYGASTTTFSPTVQQALVDLLSSDHSV